MQDIIVTGAAGFIGYHTVRKLLGSGKKVLGVDSLNDSYDPNLKRARLSALQNDPNFRFSEMDLADQGETTRLFAANSFEGVVHLAADPDVRNSFENADRHIDANVVGFVNVLNECRRRQCRHFLYASSSAVYGGAPPQARQSICDSAERSISLYAASKRANELIAHSFSHAFDLPTTGVRLFTVYGPWVRPDMAISLFAGALVKREPINLFNYGHMQRDFVYVEDVAELIVKLLDDVPTTSCAGLRAAKMAAPWRILNVGSGESQNLKSVVATLESAFGRSTEKILLPMQLGDVLSSCADLEELMAVVGKVDFTPFSDGIRAFVDWYRAYYDVRS